MTDARSDGKLAGPDIYERVVKELLSIVEDDDQMASNDQRIAVAAFGLMD